MLFNLLLFIITVICVGYLWIKKRYSYWSEQGIPFLQPEFPYGNSKGVGNKYHMSQILKKCYDKLKQKGPIAGVYFYINPIGLITSLDLVKNILVKDFQYFMNRGVYYNEKDDPLSAHLFAIDNPRWKSLRAKLTPTFTSGKMKFMFPTIIAVSKEFEKCISNELSKNSEIELKDILARFTTDVIGNCAFGLECNSLKDPNAEFRTMGRKAFQFDKFGIAKFFFMALFPRLARSFHMRSTKSDVSNFFMKVVKDTIQYREQNKVKRNDFMDLLLQLKNEGKFEDEKPEVENMSLSVEEIAAQAFVFFLAGFETSSTTMSYSLYELSLNEDIQNKAREEVQRVLQEYEGQFTYEAMMDMKYIDQIINESLRKYPPGASIIRKVTKDYKIPNSNIILKKGQVLFIPVYAIHHDPEYYINPNEFNPNRFSDEEIKKRNSYAFLPFGEGPRNCIGLRFGMMQARIV